MRISELARAALVLAALVLGSCGDVYEPDMATEGAGDATTVTSTTVPN